jgi:hypothetical protein
MWSDRTGLTFYNNISNDSGTKGYDGGLMDQGPTYIQQSNTETEKAWPYTAGDDAGVLNLCIIELLSNIYAFIHYTFKN